MRWLRRAAVAMPVALLLCLAEVGSSERMASAADPSPDAAMLVSPEGCSGPAPTGLIEGLQAQDGVERRRRFDLFVTPGYDHTRPTPLVFVFHGGGGDVHDALASEFRTAITEAGDQALIVTPQGLPFLYYGVGWNQSCRGYDMAFYDAMIRAVSRRYCVDARRIFATGGSWGADMTHALACCRGDTLRAVASFSGAETEYNTACPSRATPAARVRYGSVQGEAGDGVYTLAQFRAATDFFRRAQSCADASDPVEPAPCRAFRACRQPVLECELPGRGHDGLDAGEVAATWKFWRALP